MLLTKIGETYPNNEKERMIGNLKELPLFDFEKIATTTGNFHLDNKLGQGGFGLVYKVCLAIWNYIFYQIKRMTFDS